MTAAPGTEAQARGGATRTEVAVVGAGPAGATAARVLADAGREVLLLEAARHPRPKACGGGLPRRALDQLDLPLPPEMGTRVEAVSLLGGLAGPIRLPTPDGALVVRREAFDSHLAEAAIAAGATLRAACRVRRVERTGTGFRLRTSRGESVTARFVVCADGAASPSARILGFPRNATGFALVRRLRSQGGGPPRETAIFDLACIRTGYAWAFPEEEGWNAGIGCFRARAPDLPARLERWIVRRRDLPPAGSPPLLGGQLPRYAARRPAYAREGAYLVGDAAGLVDPLTGEGLHFALQSARLAARAILEGGESAYDAALAETLLPELDAAARLALRFRRLPTWMRTGAMTLPGFRSVAALFADLLLGRTSCRRILERIERRGSRPDGLPVAGRG